MSLLNSFWKVVTGVDLQAEQELQDATDARLKEVNQEHAEFGFLTQSQADMANSHIDASRIDTTSEVNAAFTQGVKDASAADVKFLKDTLPGGINAVLSGTLGAIFKAVPVSVWLLAAVALFVWMGGATLLKGRLAK